MKIIRNPTGKGGIKKGEVRNPYGARKGTIVKANDFKEWAFDFWQKNIKDFEENILEDKYNKMSFLKMLASFVPQEIDLGNKNNEPLQIIIRDAKTN